MDGENPNEIAYSGENEATAFWVFGESNRKMYEMRVDPDTRELIIDGSLWLSRGQSSVDHMRIPKNVLMALLGDYSPSLISGP